MNPSKKLAAILLMSIAMTQAAFAAQAINTFGTGGSYFTSPKQTGIAIRGYDTVAYFTDSKPVKGSEKFTHEWMGAKWQFASQDHLDKFKAEPTKYAPQYGGYCAYGIAKDNVVKIEPDQFTVINNKLYLNYDASVNKKWRKDTAGFIKQANAKFSKVIKQ